MASMTLTIPDAKFNEFKEAFLVMNPVPVNPDTELPLFTDGEWIKEWIIRIVKKRYKQGREELARRKVVVDNGVIN